ncbi:MAG: caspase family protein [Paludibacteraceae bacterium]|nr:caspase family protein [Paludibacteraceae bacterium]
MKKKLSVLLLVLLGLGQLNAQKTAIVHIINPGGLVLGQSTINLKINDLSHGLIAPKSYISMDVPVGFLNIIANCTLPVYETGANGQRVYSGTRQVLTQTSLQVEADKEYYVKITDNIIRPELKVLETKEIAKIEKKLNNTISFAGAYSAIPEDVTSNSNSKVGVSAAKNTIVSDVDKDIPHTSKSMDDTYALIIANEEYQFVDPVNFASHDGEVFKEYCIKTLGIPEKQIRYCPNASYGILTGGIDWLKYALDNFENSKAIVYYCGHGIPDEKTGDAYIIPVDGMGTNTTTCYSLNQLYKTLSSTKASRITYFMDACFTGANKEGSMLVAARGVAREAKKETLAGNAVVFSASSGDETAMTYAEKGHGLFTYFLLKKLQETEGNVSYQELYEYINQNVKKEAFLINEKPQTPIVATSNSAASSWKTMKL